MTRARLLLAALLMAALAVPARGEAAGKELYILVTREAAGPALDLGALGGEILGQWRGAAERIVVTLPPEAAEALARDPRVKILQKVETLGEASPSVSASSVVQHGAPSTIESHAGSLTWAIGPYRYDGARNILEIGTQSGVPDTYVYDGSSRLVSASVTSGVTRLAQTYRYDAFSNLRRVGELVVRADAATNRLDPAMGASYDAAGNVTALGGSTFVYDAFGMVTERRYEGGGSDLYLYTANDERIAVRSGRAPQAGYWSWTVRDLKGRIVREYESSGAELGPDPDPLPFLWVEDYAYRGATLLGSEREAAEGGRRHFHTDHLGTPRVVTDAAGQRVAHHDYYPFGVEASSMRQDVARGFDREEPARFTGHERDFNAGTLAENQGYLDYMHARYYSPVMGRFLSVDPAMDLKANLPHPQRWNRYSYVSNNPVKKVDPDGRDEWAMEQRLGGYDDDWERDKPQAQMLAAVGVAALTPGGITAAGQYLMQNPQILLAAMGWGMGMTGGPNPVRVGRIGEELAGITRQKIAIQIPGTFRVRIPDELTVGTLREIKNVARQANTAQLRDFMKYAQSLGIKFVLEVRKDTVLSKPLQKLVADGLIEIRRTLPAK